MKWKPGVGRELSSCGWTEGGCALGMLSTRYAFLASALSLSSSILLIHFLSLPSSAVFLVEGGFIYLDCLSSAHLHALSVA